MGTRPANPLMAECGAPVVIALSESLSSKSFAAGGDGALFFDVDADAATKTRSSVQ